MYTFKKIFSRLNLMRLLLLAGATAIIMAVLPHADHQSYSYELNQPWKYPLLTAEFDMPILRDSASANKMHDSIDAHFGPFVKRNALMSTEAVERFNKAMEDKLSPNEIQVLGTLLRNVYSRGVLDPDIYDKVAKQSGHSIRLLEEGAEGEEHMVRTVDATGMYSPAKAFAFVDSSFTAASGNGGSFSPDVAKALSVCLQPDITIDSVADNKYRSQEYLNVNGATGVIKKGQRIVDRGEIVNAQIFTNLNTYQEMLEHSNEENAGHTYYYMGQTIYILMCFLALYLFLMLYRNSFFASLRKMTFLMAFITFFVVYAIIMFEFVDSGLNLVPFAAIPVIVLVFFDSRTAIFSLVVAVMLATLVATFPFQFIFLELSAGLFACFSIRQLSKRSQLLRTALVAFVVYVVCYIAIMLLNYGNFDTFTWRTITYFAINSVVMSFAYVLIFLVEKLFGFTSTVTLVELSDINSPLLRRLSEEAPGTFQHSMQVSMLASEAARNIGVNVQLVRTGALYHDIGKLESPVFFTENQHGVNPHSGLNPETSAQKIIKHVTGGLQLASKMKLPKVLRDFISEHHGKGVTKFFYNTAVNDANGTEIDKSKFQYPGPNPQSRETAILMMADSVEAASRSLTEYSPESISKLVDKIVDSQVADGLLKESPISFKEVEIVKDTFKKRLATIYHSRVAYPELKKAR